MELAGVLLVFPFLIIPAVAAMRLAAGFKARVLTAWGLGVLTSLAGIAASASLNLPTGPAIVCAFGPAALLSLAAGRRGIRR